MSVMPETTPSRRHSVSLVALYRNARQPVRTFCGPLIVVGRSRHCDLILGSESVAPVHSALVFSRGQCFACDLGAPRGTLINGRPVRCQRLSDGDELTVGNFRFRIENIVSEPLMRAGPPRFSLTGSPPVGRINCADPLLVIGSDLGADLVIRDKSVAAVQCVIAWTDEGVLARDVGGGVGLTVNGRHSPVEVLRAGDVLVIGPHDVRFDADARALPGTVDASDRDDDSGASASHDIVRTGNLPPAPVAESATAGLSLSHALDSTWPQTLTESDEMSLDVELSRDIRDISAARSQVAEAKQSLERERTANNRPALLSAEALSEVMTTARGGGFPATDHDYEAERRALEAERAVIAAERATLENLRAELDSHKRQASMTRSQADSARVELERRVRELEDEGRRAQTTRTELEAERTELLRLRAELEAQHRDISTVRNRQRQEQAELTAQRSALANEVALLSQRRAELAAETESAARDGSRHAEMEAEVEAARDELAKVAGEIETLRKQSLRDRTTINELMATLETARRERDAIRAKSSEESRTRHADLEAQAKDLATRTAALEKRAAELESREQTIAARTTALRERIRGEQQKLDEYAQTHRRELDEQREQQRKRQTELEELSAKLDSARQRLTREVEEAHAERTRDIEDRSRQLDERAAVLQRRIDEFEERSGGIRDREDKLSQASAELVQREATLNTFESALQDRDARLREWQVRVDKEGLRLETQRREAETAQRDATSQREQIERLRVELNRQRESIGPAMAKLEAARSDVQDRQQHLEQFKEALDQRDANATARAAELESWAARVAKQEEQLADANQRIAEAKKREEAVAAVEAGIASRTSQLTVRESELSAIRQRLDRRNEELDARESIITNREGAVAQAREEFAAERAAADKALLEARMLRETVNKRTAECEARESETRRRTESLEKREAAQRSERQQLDADREELRSNITQLAEAQEALTADLAELARQRNDLDLRATTLASDQEALQRSQNEVKQSSARIDQSRRELDEMRSAVETRVADLDARAEALERKDESANQRETELQTRHEELERRHNSLQSETQIVAFRTAELDAARRDLDERTEVLRREQAEFDRVRFDLTEKQQAHDAAAAKLDAERRAVEQTRVTYAAGLAQLETRQRELAERELAAAEQSRQSAALQARMEAELDRLQFERSELLANKGGADAEAHKLKIVAGQLDAERLELRRQEESLVAHEQALRARTEQLAQIERHLQDRSRELDARASAATMQREESERHRAELMRELQNERATAAMLRTKVDEELLAARVRQSELSASLTSEINSRRAELEREYAQLRENVEVEVRAKIESQARQQAAAESERLVAERLREFDAELSRRREEWERQAAERRAAVERDLESRRREAEEWVEQARKLRADAERAVAAAPETSTFDIAPIAPVLSEPVVLAESPPPTVDTAPAIPVVQLRPMPGGGWTDISAPVQPLNDDMGDVIPLTEAIPAIADEAPPEPADHAALAELEGAGIERFAAAPEPAAVEEPSPAETAQPPRTRRWRTWSASLAFAALIGLVVFGGMRKWATPADKPTRASGRLQLASTSARDELLSRLNDAAYLSRLSSLTSTDWAAMLSAKRLTIHPDAGSNDVRIDADDPALVDVFGKAIAADLSAAPAANVLPVEIDEQKLNALRAAKEKELKQAQLVLDGLSHAVSIDDSAKKLAAAEKLLADRRAALDTAESVEARAAGALSAAQSGNASDSAVPQAELAAALAADPPYSEAAREQQSKGRGLYGELLRIANDTQDDFASFDTALRELKKTTASQQQNLADSGLSRALVGIDEVVASISIRRDAAARQWDEIVAGAKNWKEGDDPTVLVVATEKAGVWFGATQKDLGELVQQLDQRVAGLATAGVDAAKRESVRAEIEKRRRAAVEMGKQVMASAAQILPRENYKIHALSEAVTDLGRRADRRRSAIEQVLRQENRRFLGAEQQKKLAALQSDYVKAQAARDGLLREFKSAEDEVVLLRRAADRASKRREELTAQHVNVAKLKGEIEQIDEKLERGQSPSTPVAPAAVEFHAAASTLPGWSAASQSRLPILAGLLAACLFAAAHRAWVGRGRRREVSVAAA